MIQHYAPFEALPVGGMMKKKQTLEAGEGQAYSFSLNPSMFKY